MTLYIELPIHCRDAYLLDSKNTTASRLDRIEEKGSSAVSVGANANDVRADSHQPASCCGSSSSRRSMIVSNHSRPMDVEECLASDPDLITASFPSPATPRLTILISPRPTGLWHRAKTLSTGIRFLCISTSFDARVCAALVSSCQLDSFRENFLRAVIETFDARDPLKICRPVRSREILILAGLRWPSTLPLDAAFSRRVLRLLHDRLDLEIAMAWLSTLGGGFSALGDYYAAAAEKAQKISLAQMKLARDMGDPIVAAKAWVWFSLALIQKGQLRTAKWIVKKQLMFSRTKTGMLDPRLKRMCKGVFSRIKYLCESDELDR